MSKKTDEVSKMEMELENANIKLQEKVLVGHFICSCLIVAFGNIKVQPYWETVGRIHCKT